MIMKLGRMFVRSIRDSFKSVIRNFSLSIASITCITITLLIIAVSLVASTNVENITHLIKKDLTTVVFLKKDIAKEKITEVDKQLKNIKNIDKIKFQSKEEAKIEMQKKNEIFNSVMAGWKEDENPLKDSYQIKVKDIEIIKETVATIKSIDGVDVVTYGEGMVENILTAFNTIEKGTIVFAVALIVVTIFLIINTIKLTILNRKREISIMRLVGASNFSIKTPFVIEGMILGMIGAVIPIVITMYGYMGVYTNFNGQLYSPLFKLITPEPFIYLISLVLLTTGMIVGMIGSSLAVRKYLKV